MLSKPIASMLAVLTLGVASVAYAQPSDNRTYFTFSAPVTVPGATLPAGKYLFRIADGTTSRKVVNILSEDGRKSLAMLHTIPNQAREAPKDPEIRFMEVSAGVPPPVKTWWYPGRSIGYEFIYPRKQALELAKAAKEPVLTTKTETTEIAKADLSRIDGAGLPEDVKIEESPAAVAVTGRAERGEIATDNVSAAPARSAGGQAGGAAPLPPREARADERARATTRTELPRTATSLPTAILIGALMTACGLGLASWRLGS
jgi:hypothetical protein